jgi:3-deoxy-D-manno-octulosonate 8-phosphate phosphatase (KDO 8-P phosphatase)
MNEAWLATIPNEVKQRAARVKLAAFDVDGVLTDGRLWFGADGSERKAFDTQDGLGLKLLRDFGIEVALITARESEIVTRRARELALRHVYQGQRDKRACLAHLAKALGLEAAAIAYTGDDLPDLAPMRDAGLAIAVANAHDAVRERAHWTTQRSGGRGAVREVCDLLLGAQGHGAAVLARFDG